MGTTRAEKNDHKRKYFFHAERLSPPGEQNKISLGGCKVKFEISSVEIEYDGVLKALEILKYRAWGLPRG